MLSIDRMTLGSMRALSATVRHGSMTKAAEELGVSQPAISQHIRKIENILGVPLISRMGNDILVERDDIVRLFSAAETLINMIEGLANSRDLKLPVLGIQNEFVFLLDEEAGALDGLLKRFRIILGSYAHLRQLMTTGQIDVMLGSKTTDESEDEHDFKFESHIEWIKDRRSTENNSGSFMSLILPGPDNPSTMAIRNGLDISNVNYAAIAMIDDLHARASMVSRGLGIGAFPAFAARRLQFGEGMTRVESGLPVRIKLRYEVKPRIDRVTRAALNFLVEQISKIDGVSNVSGQ